MSIVKVAKDAGEEVVAKSNKTGVFLTRFCERYLGIRKPPLSKQVSQNSLPAQQPQYSDNDESGRRWSKSSSLSSASSSSSELEQIFTYFDDNGDGKISASELQTCLRALGKCDLSDEEAENAVRSSDADGDGMLGFHDFAKLMESADDNDKFQELKDAFGMYQDDEKDGEEGYITPKSLRKMLSRLGQSTSIKNCRDMISKFDLNGDGLLNFDEFRIMMH